MSEDVRRFAEALAVLERAVRRRRPAAERLARGDLDHLYRTATREDREAMARLRDRAKGATE